MHAYGIIHVQYTFNLEFICYDDGCHLRKYANNPKRKDLTVTTRLMSELEIVIDKMHMKGHTDMWCKDTCDPLKFSELNSVSDDIVAQVHTYYLLCSCSTG